LRSWPVTPTLAASAVARCQYDTPNMEQGFAVAITERFGRAADGTLVPINAGSTLPVVHKVAHAGIVEVRRYRFWL
jgi:hypothetical protein